MREGVAAWAGRWIGRSFRDRGRGPDDFDCWGLARAVFHEQTGIRLPSYDDSYPRSEDQDAVDRLIHQEKPGWTEVALEDAQPLDFLEIDRRGLAGHVGIVVGGGYFLHIAPTHGSVIEDYRSMKWRRRIRGCFRWLPGR